MFGIVFWTYAVLRLHGWRTGQLGPAQQAVDVLAMGAPVLVPRLAFNLLSDNLVMLSLRSMMADFTLLTALAAWYVRLSTFAMRAHMLTNLKGVFSDSCCLWSGWHRAAAT